MLLQEHRYDRRTGVNWRAGLVCLSAWFLASKTGGKESVYCEVAGKKVHNDLRTVLASTTGHDAGECGRVTAYANPYLRREARDAGEIAAVRIILFASEAADPRRLLPTVLRTSARHSRLLDLALANTALHEPEHFIANLDDVADINESMKGESHVAFPASA
jgi:hypothetical protein